MPPLQSLFGRKPPVSDSPDLRRILALPRRPRVEPGSATAEALINHSIATYGLGPRQCRCAAIQRERKIKAKPCIERPNYAQAWALHELAMVGGMVGQLAVGSGKTLIDILAPLAIVGCRIAVLLIPSTLVGQFITEYKLVAEHFRVPGLAVHSSSKGDETKPDGFKDTFYVDRPTLHVMPYSHFQRAKNTTFLERFHPDFIIVDEAQNLASKTSTRGSRFLRYFASHGSSTRLIAMSGTLTDDELTDYDHFMGLALRGGSPLPQDQHAMAEWNDAITPDDWPAPEGALVALKNDPEEHIQDAFHRRLVETPGVIMTFGASIEAELEILERPAPPMPDVQLADPLAPGCPAIGVAKGWWPGVDSALKYLRDTWRRPDGELLVDALSMSRCARELACGLFLRWKFIHGETREAIDEWKEARYLWRSEMKDKLLHREPHLDSPLLCANAARRAWQLGSATLDPTDIDPDEDDIDGVLAAYSDPDLPVWRAESWPRWAAIKDQVRPVTEAIRLDPFLARDAADWALQNRGIVWYNTVSFGQWVAQLSGLPLHGGGQDAGERIAAEDGSRSIVASIKSHGTGRDGLQRLFSAQLVTQSPASAVAFEQLFGRLSRIGQEADVVTALIYRHTKEVRQSIDTALRRAAYVGRTMGSQQRLRSGWKISPLT